MKVPLAICLILFGCSTVVLGLPATTQTSTDPRKDVELIPQNPFGGQPIVDTGYGWTTPFANPFGNLFDNIEGIMARMRQQMQAILKQFPSVYSFNNNGTDIAFGPGIPDDVDPSKVNATSVTKVIDGHKVIINDTEYKNSDEHGGSFFHIRVIDVKPNSGEVESTEGKSSSEEKSSTSPPPLIRDRESVENTIENEIPKSKEYQKHEEKRYANIESFDEIDPIEQIENDIDNDIPIANREWVDSIAQPSIRHVNYPQTYPQQQYAWGMRYPQAGDSPATYPQPIYPQRFYPQTNYPQNGFPQMYNNPLVFDNYPPRYSPAVYPQRYPPYDLSRDTYVNEILAQRGAPTNPNAEVFDASGTPPRQSIVRNRDPR